jgi:hypothetical protein
MAMELPQTVKVDCTLVDNNAQDLHLGKISFMLLWATQLRNHCTLLRVLAYHDPLCQLHSDNSSIE